MNQFISNSEQDTIEYACTLAKSLTTGDILILSGELGAGKTKFVQGILKNFDLENEISSPTFTIVNEYTNSNVNIYHFDLYRLENVDEFYAIGGDEYLQKGICIFEWGEIIEKELKRKYTKITFEKDPTNLNKRILMSETGRSFLRQNEQTKIRRVARGVIYLFKKIARQPFEAHGVSRDLEGVF